MCVSCSLSLFAFLIRINFEPRRRRPSIPRQSKTTPWILHSGRDYVVMATPLTRGRRLRIYLWKVNIVYVWGKSRLCGDSNLWHFNALLLAEDLGAWPNPARRRKRLGGNPQGPHVQGASSVCGTYRWERNVTCEEREGAHLHFLLPPLSLNKRTRSKVSWMAVPTVMTSRWKSHLLNSIFNTTRIKSAALRPRPP